MTRSRLFRRVAAGTLILGGFLWLAYVWFGAQISRSISATYFPDKPVPPLVSSYTLIGTGWSLVPFGVAAYLLWPRRS